MNDWHRIAEQLTTALHLDAPPIAISFADTPPRGVPRLPDPMPEPLADGRTGRASAGCVFWMKANYRSFTTVADDHANCSVGSLTHGFINAETAAGRSDVATLVESGWVTPDVVPAILV